MATKWWTDNTIGGPVSACPILSSQEARQLRERNRFLAIVCTDNPYEEVWQPAEGTCEAVFIPL